MAPAKADTCTGCAKKIKKSGENVIICDECGCTQHTVCSGVPDEYADKSQDLRKYGFRWFCKACTDIKLGLTAANALPRDDLDEFKEELRSSVREITTNLKQMIESEVREAILSSRNLEKETADVLLQPPPPPSGDKSWAEVVGMQEGNSGFQTVNYRKQRKNKGNEGPTNSKRNQNHVSNPQQYGRGDSSAVKGGRDKAVGGKHPVMGNSQNSNLRAVKPRFEGARRIFITRLHPSTTVEEVLENIHDLKVDANVVRLKTRFNSYSSFCIETSIKDYEVLMCPDNWGEGVMLLPFYGRFPKDDCATDPPLTQEK